MHSYITKELPEIVSQYFHVNINRMSISGFSMGGMGALVASLRHPGQYRSVSAFAPIAHASESSFGKNAFDKLLGSVEAGADYDPTILIQRENYILTPTLID